MKRNTWLVTIIAMMTMLICLTACERQDKGQQIMNPPAPTNLESGQLHNEFLELMPYDESTLPTSDDELVALSTQRFSELLSDQGISRAEIENVLRQTNYMLTDLYNQGIMRFALDEQHPMPFDSARLAEWLVINKIIAVRDYDVVLAFIDDFQLAGATKTAESYDAVARKWSNSEVVPAAVVNIMSYSNHFWNVEKKRPSTNAEIVQYDTVGGLIGFWFGGVGSILGAGLASYMAAIYCTDPSCPPDKSTNLLGNPVPIRDFREMSREHASIFKKDSSTSQAGFLTNTNAQQKAIVIGTILSLLALILLRRHFANEGLAGLGMALSLIPTSLMIGTKQFSWIILLLVIGGIVLLLRNLKKHEKRIPVN